MSSSGNRPYVMEDDESSGSEEISDSEIDSFLMDKDLVESALSAPHREFLFTPQTINDSAALVLPDFACLDPDTQERLQALLQAAGITKVSNEGRSFGDPELLKRLTSSVSSALGEAAAALTRMKSDDKSPEDVTSNITELSGSPEEGESLLSLACSAGYYELAQVLLAMRTNVEDRGSKGDCTPLMEAASAGHADIVKLLIAHGADMNAQSSTGNTPLMYACAGGHEEVVRVLLKAGADVSLHNQNGHTPLMETASAGHVGIARLLVEHGAYNQEFKIGLDSPLTLASYKGHLEMVRYLLKVGADHNQQQQQQQEQPQQQLSGRQEELHTALMEASIDGHVDVARLLFEAGAQVNLSTDSFESPLTLAACGGHTELASLLLERGANLEEPNDDGYTPLMEAARDGHDEMVSLLLDWGACVNAQTEETGETALTLACCGGHTEVAQLLLDNGAHIELGANTPLMEAAQEGRVDMVRFLIKHSADVNASTANGDTPLTYCAENGHTDVCGMLLDAGAELEHTAENGRTALMKAARAGHFSTVLHLLATGADPNKVTAGNEHTALSLACSGGHLTVVELLLQHGAEINKKLKDGANCIMEAAKGGHTSVVHLLLDWPNVKVTSLGAAGSVQLPLTPAPDGAVTAPPPPPPSLANFPSCAEMGLNPGSNNNKDSVAASSVASLLPQFFLPPASYLPNTPSQAASQLPPVFGGCGGATADNFQTAAAAAMAAAAAVSPDFSVASAVSATAATHCAGTGVASTGRKKESALTQAEKTLLKQASEKLSVAELQHLQELLKVQFQETAAQLANRSRSVSASSSYTTTGQQIGPPTSAATQLAQITTAASSSTSSVSSRNNKQSASTLSISLSSTAHPSPCSTHQNTAAIAIAANNAKSSPSLASTESSNNNKEYEQLRMKQWYEQVQKALEQKDISANNNKSSKCSSTAPGSSLPSAKNKNTTNKVAAGAGQQNLPSSSAAAVQQKSAKETISSICPAHNASPVVVSQQPLPPPVPNFSSAPAGHQISQTSLSQSLQQQQQQMMSFQLSSLEPSQLHYIQQQFSLALSQNIQFQLQQQLQQQQSANQNAATSCDVIGQQSSQLAAAAFSHQQQVAAMNAISAAVSGGGGGGCASLADPNFALASFYQSAINSMATAAIQNHAAASNVYVPVPLPMFNSSDPNILAPHAQNSNNSAGDAVLPITPKFPSEAVLPSSTAPIATHAPTSIGGGQPIDQNHAQQQVNNITNNNNNNVFNFPLSSSGFNFKLPYVTPGPPAAGGSPAATFGGTVSTAASIMCNDNSMAVAAAAAGSLNANFLANDFSLSGGNIKATQTPLFDESSMITAVAPSAIGGQQLMTSSDMNVGGGRMPLAGAAVAAAVHFDPATSATAAAAAAAYSSLTANLLNETAAAMFAGGGFANVPNLPQNLAQLQESLKQPQPLLQPQQQQIDPHPLCEASVDASGLGLGPPAVPPSVDLNSQTESNHDTALTLACAGGHIDLVLLLLNRGANIEHQDKKGFTPLILAATAGHANVVELLLQYGANPEAQSERTKDTALSLACSSGKKEVVELLLKKATNKEHRNVSDYTPLSLAASGGYTEIISLLLQYGAEINSRTGSKLGISPLMLASMNGHVQAVKLLLEKSADINAQIETNRNTALTLACFQGRHEVVKLLLEYGANVEHRAKTGLTPLMEAASGGYVEVGRILLEYGADPNSAPVPSSRDTALTISADKGHFKFVELLLQHGAQLDCKTKKGCTALWLACHGGFLDVVQALVKAGASPDAQDNRKVTPLMSAFRKAHIKVVKWLVRHVQQFPSDTDCTRYLATITDKDVLIKCKQCTEIIMAAKERQAQEANKAAAVLLQELEHEQQLAETRRQAKLRQKEKKKAKRKAKKAALKGPEDDLNEDFSEHPGQEGDVGPNDEEGGLCQNQPVQRLEKSKQADTLDAVVGADDNSCSSSKSSASASLERHQRSRSTERRRSDIKVENQNEENDANDEEDETVAPMPVSEFIKASELDEKNRVPTCPKSQKMLHHQRNLSNNQEIPSLLSHQAYGQNIANIVDNRRRRRPRRVRMPDGTLKNDNGHDFIKPMTVVSSMHQHQRYATAGENAGNRSIVKDRSDLNRMDAAMNDTEGWSKTSYRSNASAQHQQQSFGGHSFLSNGIASSNSSAANRIRGRSACVNRAALVNGLSKAHHVTMDDSVYGGAVGSWREKDSSKRHAGGGSGGPQRIYVSSQSIARVIGRGGNNINAIRESSGAHIEVEKQQKGQTDRLITLRGSSDATKQAILMINGLINEPDVPVQEIVSKVKSKDSRALEFYSKSTESAYYGASGPNNVGLTSSSATDPAKSSAARNSFSAATSHANVFSDITMWQQPPVSTNFTLTKPKPQQQNSANNSIKNSQQQQQAGISKSSMKGSAPTTSSAALPTYTTASSTKTVTVISSSAKTKSYNNNILLASNMTEYSPFSTPNVWFNRSTHANINNTQKMNFASAAAANLTSTCCTSIATSTSGTVTVAAHPTSFNTAASSYHVIGGGGGALPGVVGCHGQSLMTSSSTNISSQDSSQQSRDFCCIGGYENQSKAPGYRTKPAVTSSTIAGACGPISNTATSIQQQPSSLVDDQQDQKFSTSTSTGACRKTEENFPAEWYQTHNMIGSSSAFSESPPKTQQQQQNSAGSPVQHAGVETGKAAATASSNIGPRTCPTSHSNAAADSAAICLTNYLLEQSPSLLTSTGGGSTGTSPYQQLKTEVMTSSSTTLPPQYDVMVEGRRSAQHLNTYFSPIALPRPASAADGVKADARPSAIPGSVYSSISPVHGSSTSSLQAQQQQQQILLPTPIGGERRSKTSFYVNPQQQSSLLTGTAKNNNFTEIMQLPPPPQAPPPSLPQSSQLYQEQQQTTWQCSDLSASDWPSNFSGLSANLAQLQAMQAMENNQSGGMTEVEMMAAQFDASCAVDPVTGMKIQDSSGCVINPQQQQQLGGYENDFFNPTMWIAAYNQQNHQQNQFQQQQQHRQHQTTGYYAAPLPHSNQYSADAVGGGGPVKLVTPPPPLPNFPTFNASPVPPTFLEPWNPAGPPHAAFQQMPPPPPWKLINGSATAGNGLNAAAHHQQQMQPPPSLQHHQRSSDVSFSTSCAYQMSRDQHHPPPQHHHAPSYVHHQLPPPPPQHLPRPQPAYLRNAAAPGQGQLPPPPPQQQPSHHLQPVVSGQHGWSGWNSTTLQ